MPTNEETAVDDTKVGVIERVAIVSREAVGANSRMPARVIVLFTVAIACSTLAPLPVNIIGAGSIVLLALDTAIHRR